jgi:hypothetical protein
MSKMKIGYIWLHQSRPVAGGPSLARGVWCDAKGVAVFEQRDDAIRYGLETVAEWCCSLEEGGYTLWLCEFRPAEDLRIGGSPKWSAPYGETQYITEQGIAVEAVPPRSSLASEVRLLERLGMEETRTLLLNAAMDAARDNLSRVQRMSR